MSVCVCVIPLLFKNSFIFEVVIDSQEVTNQGTGRSP